MPWMPLSETAVANMAVDVLDDFPIASLDEDTVVGRFMNRNFWQAYGEVAWAYPWSFSRKWVMLPEDGAPPPFAWKKSYTLPDDCVRPLPLRAGGFHNGAPIPFELVGQNIYTNEPGPLPFQYIQRVTNPGLWTPPFARVLAQTLALYGALNITGKAQYVEKASGMLRQAWEQATLSDTLAAGTPEMQDRHDIINIRGLGLGGAGMLRPFP